MVDTYPFVVLAPVTGSIFYCVTHIAASRWSSATTPYAALIGGFLVGCAATLAITFAALWASQSPPAAMLGLVSLNLVTFLAFAFCYFNFVNMTFTSLRIRMLEELVDEGGSIPVATLLSRYDVTAITTLRIARLVGGGHLVEAGGRFHRGKARFLLLARAFIVLRWIIIGRGNDTAFHSPHGSPI